MKLESIDLNLLLALDALIAEQNVTRAAARVGLTQPAMSSALARLREMFGDPLLQRIGGRMQATSRARELVGPIGEALARLRTAVERPRIFDATQAAHEFRLGTTDYGESILIAPLAGRIASAAPRVTLRTLRVDALFTAPVSDLQSEKIDVAVAFATTVSPSAGIVSTPLYHEPLVCVVRRGHPRVRRGLDLDTFLALSHVRILYPRDERVGLIDVLLRERALKRRIGIAIPHLLSVVDIVTASDLVGTVPQRMAQAWEKRGAVRMFPLPLDVPPLTVNMLYLERARFDPAHMWLRVQIEGVATTLAECQPAA